MKTKYLLLGLFISILCASVAMAGYSLSDIQNMTKGVGVFYVTVNNYGDHEASVVVTVGLNYPPKGYEDRFSGSCQIITVGAHSSIQTLFLKPLVGDFPYYEGVGPELPNSHQVKVSLGVWGRSYPGLCRFYPAEYVFGTKFIEVPDTTFNIGLGDVDRKIKYLKTNSSKDTDSKTSPTIAPITESSAL